MRRNGALITVLCVLTMVFAAQAPANVAGDRLKWSQLPDMENGWDVPSRLYGGGGEGAAADDWLCTDGVPITDIHWWGSYIDDDYDVPAGFYILIYNDLTGADPSQPLEDAGYPSAFYWFPFADANEEYVGEQQATGHDAYQYFVDLPSPFLQEEGNIYWLSVVARESLTWGWKTSADHWRDMAVYADYFGPTPDDWGDWAKINPEVDMAFELTTPVPIPVPAALLLGIAGVGLAGAGRFLRRRR